MKATPGRRPRAAAAALTVGVLALAAGCGIRGTSVPVDAGQAPSRTACAQPSTPATLAPDAVVRQVYLVCSGQIAPVPRSVRLSALPGSAAARAVRARELIGQLQTSPRSAESGAGFYSAVPVTLAVVAPQPGDPAQAVRLSQALDELPSFALGQIVCTLGTDATLSPGHTVVLGGPGTGDDLRRYTCTPDLRTSADATDNAGVPIP